MGRLPCCDKVGVKKGPWTPEEDIMLVFYVQEHGPGNWRVVLTNTGLKRCNKGCRLRWTNYLRPGIKRVSRRSPEMGSHRSAVRKSNVQVGGWLPEFGGHRRWVVANVQFINLMCSL
ncbi:hypothetical protein ACS0TY_027531 [Phlomoides rotata]